MKAILSIFITLFCSTFSYSQGRIVVNEFMAWSSCSTTSEFIELLNFGPGPMNIGCYIVTNGQYSVTIPPNTILKAGQYFVLSGQNTLAMGCGNVDSVVTVDLNWKTCNCTDKPIPTTGDGFLKDGGLANEKVVILDPALNVVDAVSRSSPASSSVALTTSSVAGSCTSKTFNLDTMNISYETIGSSTGINNSFSRKVDGDCGWVKTTQISARAANKTGSTSSATYSFSTLSASECQSTDGSISITVSASNVSTLFPMNYVLAYDADSNSVFTDSDQYRYGIDSSAPNIDITNLKYGRYRITVGSSAGCNLKTFDFFIFNCYGVVLPLELVSFNLVDSKELNWNFLHAENLRSIEVEGSYDGITFIPIESITPQPDPNNNWYGTHKLIADAYIAYRLKINSIANNYYYSSIVKKKTSYIKVQGLFPNPASTQIHADIQATEQGFISYNIYDAKGKTLLKGIKPVVKGSNNLSFSTSSLIPGFYYLAILKDGQITPALKEIFIKK